MYIALLILLLLPAFVMIRRGLARHGAGLLAGGFFWAAVVGFFFLFLDFWGEKLWFDALGYTSRFWTVIIAKVFFVFAGAILSAGMVWLMAGRSTSFAPVFSLAALFMG
ncbi:MAG TPA: hypothetical protein ENO11_06915, partial [Desulfobacteraceae bacterium]|nr:hypothetical protein [Desulfobacteraceae bacterium]